MGKTKVFFKKIRITKGTCHAKMGTCHAKMGTIKEKNGMDITEAEILRRGTRKHRRTIQ